MKEVELEKKASKFRETKVRQSLFQQWRKAYIY